MSDLAPPNSQARRRHRIRPIPNSSDSQAQEFLSQSQPQPPLPQPRPAGNNEFLKSIIFEFLATKMKESQTSLALHEQLIHEMKLFYYKEEDPTAAAAHQKFCASILWRIMLIPFMTEHNKHTDLVTKFFTNIVKSFGTDDDIEKYNFPVKNLPPLFHYIIRFIHQCHGDARALVRGRILELTKEILQKFHEVPLFVNDSANSRNILGTLYQRVKDKTFHIRVVAVQCLRYFVHESEVRRVLIQSGNTDTNSEVRKQALIALRESNSVKSTHFIGQAYNICESVRVEAFIALSKIPLSKIPNKRERQKLVLWGTTQPSSKVQNAVTKHLLPAWLKSCENSILKLLLKINPKAKVQVTRAVINGLYKDVISSDQIDRTFLNPERIIPFKELGIMNSQVWVVLCERFRGEPDYFQQLCPNGGDICNLLKEILVAIRGEEDSDSSSNDDDVYESIPIPKSHVCLVNVLRLAKLICYEEGTRRDLLEILRYAILEPKIKAPVVFSEVVHFLFLTLKESDIFESSINGILEEIFEPRFLHASNNNRDRDASSNSTTSTHPTFEDEVHSNAVTSTPMRQNKIHENLLPQRYIGEDVDDLPVSFRQTNKVNETFHSIQDRSCDQARLELADILLQKHKLISLEEKLAKASDYREANIVHNEVLKVLEKEKMLRAAQEKSRITTLDATPPGVFDEEVGSPEVPRSNQSIRYVRDLDEHSTHLSSISNESVANSSDTIFALKDSEILRGLVILTRFLSCKGRITSFVCNLYENYLLHHLVSELHIIRKYVLYVIYYVGVLDEQKARKSMQVVIAALKGDTEKSVRHAAFKCMVDLLTHYNLKTFRQEEVKDDFCPMLPPLNNPEATTEEIESMFLLLVNSSFQEHLTHYDTVLKVKSSIKLYLADRFTSEATLADLMCLYLDPIYGASLNTFQIGYFLPLYISLSLNNGHRVINAFIICLKTVYEAKYDKSNPLGQVDPATFVSFIVENTSSKVLTKLTESHILHENLALNILKESYNNVTWKHNSELCKILKSLSIGTKTSGLMKRWIDKILQKIQNLAQSVEISKLKSTLRTQLKDLEKKFPTTDEDSQADTVIENMQMMDLDEEEEDTSIITESIVNHSNKSHCSMDNGFNGMNPVHNSKSLVEMEIEEMDDEDDEIETEKKPVHNLNLLISSNFCS